MVIIDYTNWRGARAERRIEPQAIRYEDANVFHGAGWILVAFDVDKQAERQFAMKYIHSWREA